MTYINIQQKIRLTKVNRLVFYTHSLDKIMSHLTLLHTIICYCWWNQSQPGTPFYFFEGSRNSWSINIGLELNQEGLPVITNKGKSREKMGILGKIIFIFLKFFVIKFKW